MARRRVSRRTAEQEKGGPNWMIIGGIAAVGVIALLGLLVVTVTAGPSAPEPTPVLEENVVAIAEYCEANDDRCIAVGDESAPVTFLEVSDYGCPHCRDFNTESAPALKQQYVDSGLVRWIVMPYALSDQTHSGAVATLCAADQGEEAALAFHEEMFKLQNTSGYNTVDGFVSVARNVGLDQDQFEQCVENETYDSQIHLNRQAARQAGVNSTPTVFINGRIVNGNVGLEIFSQRIEEALSEG